MNLKAFCKCLAIPTLLAQFIVLPETSYASTKKGVNNKPKPELTFAKNTGKGLLGYYFKDSQFSDLIMIQPNTSSELHVNSQTKKAKQDIQSARWMGYIKPSKTGEYKLATSSDENVIIELDSKHIMNQSPMENPITLEKDKLYEIKIEYRGESATFEEFELFWSNSDIKKERIPDENLLTPNLAEKAGLSPEKSEQSLIPNVNLFAGQKKSARSKRSVDNTLQDTDRDGIPDDWEQNGYTISDGALTRWDDSYGSKGYTKYVSHPYNARTAADPYTDLEKVTGYMPAATKAEARDPLVAAYPVVGVGMERFSFSKNQNVTEGNAGTKTKTTSKTNSTTKTVDVSTNLGFSKKDGLSFGVSAGYSHSWNNSTMIEDIQGQAWSKEIGINTDQAAFLNANVRYYNTGTAPIYEVSPTTNFIFEKTKESITTIKAGPNQIGNSLSPGDTYPSKGQAPISLNQANQMGTVNISVNAEQLDSIQSGDETLGLETTQSSGQYGVLDPVNGKLVTDAGKQWDHIRSNINAVSGSLILETGKETLERKVAARDVNNPNDRTPEITVGEAIKKAFGAVERDGQLYYREQETGKEIPIHESAINIVVDKRTENEFNKQLEQMQQKNVYDIIFKRGMNITLHMPNVYDDFESSNGWEDSNHVNGGHTGKKNGMVSPDKTGYRQEKLRLKPNTSYTVRAWVKSESQSKQKISVHVDNKAGKGQGLNQELELEGDSWKLIETYFNTRNNPEYYSQIAIGNRGNANLHFDDVSITEWHASEDLARNHVVDSWHASPVYQVGGIKFSKVPKTPVRYQLEVDGKLTSISSLYKESSQGSRYINLAGFTQPQNLSPESNIIVYAVDEKNDNLKTKVAEHRGKEILNKLPVSTVNFSYNSGSNRYTFTFKTGVNAPIGNYYLSLPNGGSMPLGPIGPSTVKEISLPKSDYKAKGSYAIGARINDMHYKLYSEIGEKIPGDKGEGVYIYEAANFSGKSQNLKDNVKNFKDIGMNDKVSSMRIVGSYEVILYEAANFSGKSSRVKNDVVNFKDIGMNDKVSSIKIIGSNGAVVYENSNTNNK